ncbi:MAG TPA: DUF2818 domain-containing protein [Betaproteobacteria bacterium]|nr:DUF2818 domain-containing protein [Betaproteobacteria bacterium]
MTISIYFVLILAGVTANLSFFSERLFYLLPLKRGRKAGGWRMLELVTWYFICGGVAYLMEKRLGPVHHQKWEFYTVTACLFLVFAAPGFIYRYLWRRTAAEA